MEGAGVGFLVDGVLGWVRGYAGGWGAGCGKAFVCWRGRWGRDEMREEMWEAGVLIARGLLRCHGGGT